MRAFVTGGSGFLGRRLIETLRARGDEVRALARSEAAERQVRAAGAEPVRGDLEDEAAMTAGMRGAEVVFHAAAKVEVWGKKRDFQRITVLGTRRALGAARAASVPRFVHVSTEAVLVGGPPIVDADESWPLPKKPLGLYPWSKGRAEEEVRAAAAKGQQAVIVRPRFIWGAGDTVLLPRLREAIDKNQFMWIGGGRHLTSTCHVDNVVHGLLCAAERGRAGEAYFVTDGAPVELRAFMTDLLAAAGIRAPGGSMPRWLAMLLARIAELVWPLARLNLKERKKIAPEPPITRTTVKLIGETCTVNDAKARRELGYSPPVTIPAGLAELRRASNVG